MTDSDDKFVLEMLRDRGLDPSRQHSVEFAIDAPSAAVAAVALDRLSSKGYACDVWDDPVDRSITLHVTIEMTLTFARIQETKSYISGLLADLGMVADDWGVMT